MQGVHLGLPLATGSVATSAIGVIFCHVEGDGCLRWTLIMLDTLLVHYYFDEADDMNDGPRFGDVGYLGKVPEELLLFYVLA